jgi:hypothetical protein
MEKFVATVISWSQHINGRGRYSIRLIESGAGGGRRQWRLHTNLHSMGYWVTQRLPRALALSFNLILFKARKSTEKVERIG